MGDDAISSSSQLQSSSNGQQSPLSAGPSYSARQSLGDMESSVDTTTPKSSSSLSQRSETPSRTKSILRFGRSLRSGSNKKKSEQEQEQVAREAEPGLRVGARLGQESFLDPTRTRSRSTQRSFDSQRSRSSLSDQNRSAPGAGTYRDLLVASSLPRGSISSSKGDSNSDVEAKDPAGGALSGQSGGRASSELDSVAWRSSQSLPRESSIEEEEEWQPSETLRPTTKAATTKRLKGSLGRRKQAMTTFFTSDPVPDADNLATPRHAASTTAATATAAAADAQQKPGEAPTCGGVTPVVSRPTTSSSSLLPRHSTSGETTATSTARSLSNERKGLGISIAASSDDDAANWQKDSGASSLAPSTPNSPLSEASRRFSPRTSQLRKGSFSKLPQVQPPVAPLPPLPLSAPRSKTSDRPKQSLEHLDTTSRDLRPAPSGGSNKAPSTTSSSSGGPGSRIASRFMSKLKGTHLDDEVIPLPTETMPPTRNNVAIGVGSFVNPFMPPVPSAAATRPSGDMRYRALPALPDHQTSTSTKSARKSRSQNNLKMAQAFEERVSSSSATNQVQSKPPLSNSATTTTSQVTSEDSSLQKINAPPRRSTRRPRTSGGDIGQGSGASISPTSPFGAGSWFQRKLSGGTVKESSTTKEPPAAARNNTLRSRKEVADFSPEAERFSTLSSSTSLSNDPQRDTDTPIAKHYYQTDSPSGEAESDGPSVLRRPKIADRGRSSSVNSLDDFGKASKSRRGPAAGSHLPNRRRGTPSRPSSAQGIEVGQPSQLERQGGASSLFGGGGGSSSQTGGTPRQRASSLLSSMPWRSRTNSNAGTDQDSSRRTSISPQQQSQQLQQPPQQQQMPKRGSVANSAGSSSARPSVETQFNHDPDAFLEHVLTTTPNTEIATKLAASSGTMHRESLRLFMQRFFFSGYAFDIALRKLLMSLCLPKETQQIDRVMEAFARRYNECNERLFVNDDQPYILAFSLMMLHTDTFNRNAKTKMSKADYIRNTASSGVATEVLEYLYDNLTFTQFIYVEDEDEKHRRASDATDTGGSTKLFSALSSSSALTNKARIDPYYIISNQGDLEKFRPASILQLIPEDSPFSATGTASRFDIEALNRSFVSAPSIEIITARRVPPPGLGWGGENYAQAVMTTSLVEEEDPDSVVTLRVTKVGCISRKDDIVDNKKKAQSRKWKTWGLMLSSTQLLFFRDLVWTSALDQQIQEQTKDGKGDREGGVLITPRITYFRPDDVLGLGDAIAVRDSSYDKYNHVFRLIAKQGYQMCQYLIQTPSEKDMNDWIHKINFCATFRSLGVTIRGLDPPATGTYSPNFGAEQSSNSKSPSIDSTRRASEAAVTGQQTGMSHSSSHDSGLSRFLPPSPGQFSPGEGGILPLVSIMRRRLNARRREMLPKIEEVQKSLDGFEKQLDDKLRLARHLAITTPFQKVTRDRIEMFAIPLADEIRTLRIQVSRFQSRREMLLLELEAGDKAARAAAPAASFTQSGWTKVETPLMESPLPSPMLSSHADASPVSTSQREFGSGRRVSQPSIIRATTGPRRQDVSTAAAMENGSGSPTVKRAFPSSGNNGPSMTGSEEIVPLRPAFDIKPAAEAASPRFENVLKYGSSEEEEAPSSGPDASGSGSNSDRKVSTSSWSSTSMSEPVIGSTGGSAKISFPPAPSTPSGATGSPSDARRNLHRVPRGSPGGLVAAVAQQERERERERERDDVVDWNETKMASTHNKRISLAMLPSSNELQQQLQERIGQHNQYQHQHQRDQHKLLPKQPQQ